MKFKYCRKCLQITPHDLKEITGNRFPVIVCKLCKRES